jgi:hypothetical protein
LPCVFADPTRFVGDGNFPECHVDVMAGHFVFRLTTVGASKGPMARTRRTVGAASSAYRLDVVSSEVLMLSGRLDDFVVTVKCYERSRETNLVCVTVGVRTKGTERGQRWSLSMLVIEDHDGGKAQSEPLRYAASQCYVYEKPCNSMSSEWRSSFAIGLIQ